jgi:3-methyladenine DNA glycosylase/8-oxoguanine DNA glycosylase
VVIWSSWRGAQQPVNHGGNIAAYDRAIREVRCTVKFPGPASFGLTLAPLRRGPLDPCFQVAGDGAIWRVSRLDTGPVTARITRSAPTAVDCTAWGDGAEEFLDTLPALLGVDDDASDFAPADPTVAAAHRRVPHLRLGRTGRVLEALIPAVLEQRVPGADAFRSWRVLVTRFGTGAPGPAPPRMRVPPPPEAWQSIPSWQFHRANVDPRRARTVVGCAHRAASLERLASRSAVQAREALRSLPGVGVWTAAETAQRAFGDADALSVGDYHVPAMIGWTLLGHPIDDAAMIEILEPMRPHRHRAVRLLHASGLAYRPRRGPRLPVLDIGSW